MEKLHFEVEKDGFHGVYWQNKMPSNAARYARRRRGRLYGEKLRKMAAKTMRKRAIHVTGEKELQPSQLPA